MAGYIKEPLTSIFIGQTGCGKTHLDLELIEKEYNLYQWIQKLSELLRFIEVLFIIDDIISNKELDRRR